ncbi:unnamed protein product [Cochlearia groenlandica]
MTKKLLLERKFYLPRTRTRETNNKTLSWSKILDPNITDAIIDLTGYRMDEDDLDSKILRLQFSRNPGPRSGQRGGGRR